MVLNEFVGPGAYVKVRHENFDELILRPVEKYRDIGLNFEVGAVCRVSIKIYNKNIIITLKFGEIYDKICLTLQ